MVKETITPSILFVLWDCVGQTAQSRLECHAEGLCDTQTMGYYLEQHSDNDYGHSKGFAVTMRG